MGRPSWISFSTNRRKRVAGELGRAKEAEVRELMRRFSSQVVPGALFGLTGNLTLPIVRSVEGYRPKNGQIELDALAKFAPDAIHPQGER